MSTSDGPVGAPAVQQAPALGENEQVPPWSRVSAGGTSVLVRKVVSCTPPPGSGGRSLLIWAADPHSRINCRFPPGCASLQHVATSSYIRRPPCPPTIPATYKGMFHPTAGTCQFARGKTHYLSPIPTRCHRRYQFLLNFFIMMQVRRV